MDLIQIQESTPNAESLARYHAQALQLKHNALHEFHDNKEQLLQHQVTQLVEQARTELEGLLVDSEKACFYNILASSMNLL